MPHTHRGRTCRSRTCPYARYMTRRRLWRLAGGRPDRYRQLETARQIWYRTTRRMMAAAAVACLLGAVIVAWSLASLFIYGPPITP
ncbi:hypothetical protein [Actinomadura sp. 21ATH]|uniref:hypothetical protein n=1 Tax=Actinomadura sp. 21ATH TaxID=1735444 RepID=UPI0035C23F96